MPKTESTYTLTIKQWGRTDKSEADWHHAEFERIAGMIGQGYTSGEIVSEDSDGGWWELTRAESEQGPRT